MISELAAFHFFRARAVILIGHPRCRPAVEWRKAAAVSTAVCCNSSPEFAEGALTSGFVVAAWTGSFRIPPDCSTIRTEACFGSGDASRIPLSDSSGCPIHMPVFRSNRRTSGIYTLILPGVTDCGWFTMRPDLRTRFQVLFVW